MIRETLLKAIEDSGETLYRIAKETGVHHTVLSRFVSGANPDIRIFTADKVAAYLGLQLTKAKRRK